jgi:hypothetical protein
MISVVTYDTQAACRELRSWHVKNAREYDKALEEARAYALRMRRKLRSDVYVEECGRPHERLADATQE